MIEIAVLNSQTDIHGVAAQDVAVHGYYTEPTTGIVFYTSSEPNGTVIGDGFFSPVSLGGFTWGIALPEDAATVDSYDYLGLLVSLSQYKSDCHTQTNRVGRLSS